MLSCQARLGAELLAGLGDKADLLGWSANLALQQLEQACTCPSHRDKLSTSQALFLHITFGRKMRQKLWVCLIINLLLRYECHIDMNGRFYSRQTISDHSFSPPQQNKPPEMLAKSSPIITF